MPLPGQRLYANSIWLGAYVDNFMVGRQGNAIQGILDHHSASTLQGLVARFTTSSGVSGGGVSAHFAVDREEEVRDGLLGHRAYGVRYQFVDTDDTAFHAGDFDANRVKVGIEHVRQWGSGPGTGGYEPITDAQYASSTELHMILAADCGFPLDLTHVEPHNHYTATTCPGDLDLNRIINPSTGGDMATRADSPDLFALLDSIKKYLVDVNEVTLDRLEKEIKAVQPGTSADLTPLLSAVNDLKAMTSALGKHLGVGSA